MRRFFMFLFFCFCLCSALIAQQDVRLTTYDGALVRSTNPLPVDASVTIGSITVSVFPVYADESGNPATCTVDADYRAWVNLASDTIGLVDAILAMSSTSTADISALQAAVASVTSEIENSGVNASETVLIAKLDELLSASASETVVVSAISTVDSSIASVSSDIASISGDISRLETGVKSPTTVAQQTITLTPGAVTTITSLSNRRSVSLKSYTSNTESVWLSYDNVSTAAAVLSGDELAPGARISIDLPEGLTVGIIASTAETVYACEQGD